MTELKSLWQKVGDDPWHHVTTDDAERVEESAQGLRRYAERAGIPDHRVEVLDAGQVPDGYQRPTPGGAR